LSVFHFSLHGTVVIDTYFVMRIGRCPIRAPTLKSTVPLKDHLRESPLINIPAYLQ
jgi:hypothetical protein